MRILHIGKFYPPDRGGMETFLEHLSRRQAAQGHEVFVLAHAGAAGPGLTRPAPGLGVLRLPVRFSAGGYAPVAPGLALAYLRALRSFRPELVHVHAPNAAALWPALHHGGAPLVLHWHADVDFPPDRQPPGPLLACWRRLEGFMLRRARVVVATSQAYLDASAPLAPHRAKCRVVPLGLAEPAGLAGQGGAEHPAARFLDAAPGLRVLAVGRLSHYKGFGVLLKALARTPGASLCLVGAGEEGPALAALAAGQDLAGRVLLAGELPEAALCACLRRADALCLPSLSRSEAFGMVLLEAMARGLPCVASNVPGGGMAEVLDQGRAGLLAPPGDVEALAQALRRLAGDRALREQLGRAGRERFAACYEISAVARQLDELYRQAIAGQPLAPAGQGGRGTL